MQISLQWIFFKASDSIIVFLIKLVQLPVKVDSRLLCAWIRVDIGA